MFMDYPVDYIHTAIPTATIPPVISYVETFNETTGSKKIAAGDLLSYFQKDSSFIYDKTFDENEDDEGYASEDDIRLIISRFEKQFNMTSEEFLQLRSLGKAPDTFETMLWKTLLKAI